MTDRRCGFCKHPKSKHFIYNEGSCGDICCANGALEAEFCEKCNKNCWFFGLTNSSSSR